MTRPSLFAPGRPARFALSTAAAAIVGVMAGGLAHAQAPAPAPAAPRPAQAQPAKPAPAKPAAPAQAQQAPAPAAPQGQAQGPAEAQLIYSPWTKICNKDQQSNKQVCYTAKDGRLEDGRPVVVAVLIEAEGEPKKLFRVTVPAGLSLQEGTRILVDQQNPATAPYIVCIPFQNVCVAEYEGSPELIANLKKGQTLFVQGVNLQRSVVTFPLPLADFGKAADGPAIDPKVLEERQKKLQDELQKRAEEARKRLEAQPGANAAPGAAPR